ncbi:MAG: hypothetical protein K2P92_01995 [Bdellovibrionaceae bacterium]|nr:hypothetical protein [Pseudobdellovibrionaceae bacterium]
MNTSTAKTVTNSATFNTKVEPLVRQDNTLWVNLFLGGFSLITCFICWTFIDRGQSVLAISQVAVTLAFIVNHPHFASSYMLLYKDFGGNIRTNLKYFWAAAVVPTVLLGYLGYCLVYERADLLGHSVNAMFFLVGWHYVKQIFGVVIVTSALKKTYYSVSDRYILLLNLFSIWAISFFNSQTYLGSFDFYGIQYKSFGLSPLFLNMSYSVFAASLIYIVAIHIKRYVNDGSVPTTSAIVAMASLYVWYLPVFAHPHFAYLIPFFHSLQYLVFVWFFKKNQVTAQLETHNEIKNKRKAWVMSFVGYIVVALILGAIFFEFLPKSLDTGIKFQNAAMGASPFLVAFLLFINIHHYFIDNVIWKSANPEVKKHLFLH